MVSNKVRLRVSLAVALGFFLVNLIFVLVHEQFCDEANTWQIAKVLTPMNFVEVFGLEPHPLLWTFLIMPFAKLGFPLITQNVLALAVMSLAAFVLVRYAPFKVWVKILLVLSGMFMLYFPVIARDYCLVVLGLMLAAATYEDRLKHPMRHFLALCMLFQSHFLAFPVAAMLTGYFIYDLKRAKRRVMPYVVGLVLCVGTVALCAVGPLLGHGVIRQSDRNVAIDLFAYLEGVNVSLFGVALPVFEVVFLTTVLLLLRYRTRATGILVVACVAQSLVLLVIYRDFAAVLKNALMLHYIIFALWIAMLGKPVESRRMIRLVSLSEIVRVLYHSLSLTFPLVVLAVVTLPRLVVCGVYEVRWAYDLSHELAAYVNGLPDGTRVVTLDDDVMAVGAAPFLEGERTFWSLESESAYIYFKLGAERKVRRSLEDVKGVVGRNFAAQEEVYILFTSEHAVIEGVEILKEFTLRNGLRGYTASSERFLIGRINR